MLIQNVICLISIILVNGGTSSSECLTVHGDIATYASVVKTNQVDIEQAYMSYNSHLNIISWRLLIVDERLKLLSFIYRIKA